MKGFTTPLKHISADQFMNPIYVSQQCTRLWGVHCTSGPALTLDVPAVKHRFAHKIWTWRYGNFQYVRTKHIAWIWWKFVCICIYKLLI